jgi:predicted hotdog family 3-hydroxylacyl-ACP dehydratase
MFLLSRVTAVDKNKHTLSAEYDVGKDCLFYDSELGGVPSWVGIECMAQSISALSGIANRDEGRKPKPGFILSVTGLELGVPFLRSGEVFLIQVREDYKADAIFTYDCGVSVKRPEGSFPVGKAKLTVMETDDISLWANE